MQGTDIGELVRQTMLVLVLIIVAAKLGGAMMKRIGQPPVLGELLMGIFLGNLALTGITLLEPLKNCISLEVLAQIGAILLLFEVGVESDLIQLLSVGPSALLVATLGVIAPMILGYFASTCLMPQASWLTHLFVGGTLTATSVGITARVLGDMGLSKSKEARVILGAAVADDIIGLLVFGILSAVAASVQAGTANAGIDWLSCLWSIAKACLFLVLAVLAGRLCSKSAFAHTAKLDVPAAHLGLCICFCFVLATLAGLAGLSPIVGAFAAGVVLEEAHYQPFLEKGERTVQELLFPITTLIVPFFFVFMGMNVDIHSLFSQEGLLFASLLTAAAVVGKQVCALGVIERGIDRLSVGIGMIPRGEVGLIFAGMGSTILVAGNPILSQTMFSSLIITIMLTTLVTPPLLKAVMERKLIKEALVQASNELAEQSVVEGASP